jgi:hypothetical protein
MSHWQTPPALDPRPVPAASKGLRAPGHTGTPEDCTHPACVEARRVKAGVTRQRRARGGAEGAARALAREPVLLPVVSEPEPVSAPDELPAPSTLTLRVPVPELRPLTVRELLLLAAADVASDDTAKDIALGDLVVRAWERDHDRFGLPGHELHYPHSNRVLAKLAGADGVCGLGWLRLHAPNTWRLTTKGRRRARDLRALAVLLEARAAA